MKKTSRFIQFNPDEGLNIKIDYIRQHLINQNLRNDRGLITPEHYYTKTFAVESSIVTMHRHFNSSVTKLSVLEWVEMYNNQKYGPGLTVRCRQEILYLMSSDLLERLLDISDISKKPFIHRNKPNQKAIASIAIFFAYQFISKS